MTEKLNDGLMVRMEMSLRPTRHRSSHACSMTWFLASGTSWSSTRTTSWKLITAGSKRGFVPHEPRVVLAIQDGRRTISATAVRPFAHHAFVSRAAAALDHNLDNRVMRRRRRQRRTRPGRSRFRRRDGAPRPTPDCDVDIGQPGVSWHSPLQRGSPELGPGRNRSWTRLHPRG